MVYHITNYLSPVISVSSASSSDDPARSVPCCESGVTTGSICSSSLDDLTATAAFCVTSDDPRVGGSPHVGFDLDPGVLSDEAERDFRVDPTLPAGEWL